MQQRCGFAYVSLIDGKNVTNMPEHSRPRDSEECSWSWATLAVSCDDAAVSSDSESVRPQKTKGEGIFGI